MEKELVLQAQAGSSVAFSRLIEAYCPRIFRAAYSFLRNSDDAYDIVQDVCIRAFEKIDTFDAERSFYPWIYRITKNMCINKVNRKESKNTSLLEQDVYASHHPGPEKVVERQEDATAVRDAIDELTPMHREIILLKHFQDCSYEQIAEILDIPIGTVMSRLYNARQKLKEKLMEEVH